jgi:hypothetical protein
MNGRLYVGLNSIYSGGSVFTGGGGGGSSSFTADVSMNGNAYVAKSFNIGVSGNLFQLDVSGAVNFRGTVNPITFPDGSVISTGNSTNLDFVNNFGNYWNYINPTAPTLNGWGPVGMSATGQYIIVTIPNSTTWYYSTNYGTTYNQGGGLPAYNWRSVAMSANGQSYTIVGGNYIYYYNYGPSYFGVSNGFSTAYTYYNVCMTPNGQYQIASANDGGLYICNNIGGSVGYNGYSWTKSSTAPLIINGYTAYTYYCAMSSSGQYQALVIYSNSYYYIYLSSNFGTSFQNVYSQPSTSGSYTYAISNIYMSPNGQYISAGGNNYIPGSGYYNYIWYSTNYGNTFSANSCGFSSNYTYVTSIGIPNNSGYQVATVYYSPYIYITYSAKGWYDGYTSRNAFPGSSSGTNLYWNSIAISANGQYIAASTSGTSSSGTSNAAYAGLYLSTTPSASNTFSNLTTMLGDVSMNGNLAVSKLAKLSAVSEVMSVITSSTPPYTIDFSTAGTFYLVNQFSSSNFTVYVVNVPSDINRSYVFTLMYPASTYKGYCNTIQVSSTGTASGTNLTVYFANGSPSTIAQATYITQTISIVRTTAGDANATVLSTVTAWY